ncbi:MAG: hypothetical protein M3O62_05355 [Pseudomonadota bacterium]|nr:hypothetical protein [Pseudomonadota bacterium]
MNVTSVVSCLAACTAFLVLAGLPAAHAQDATALQARHADLLLSLDSNPFQRPIHLESSDVDDRLAGDIYARIDQPYAVVGPALQDMAHWCDILILHQNVKHCMASADEKNTLNLSVGRKHDQPLGDAFQFEFQYAVIAADADYLQIELHARQGPIGTSDYRIMLEVAALDARRSFLHLSYGYNSGVMARAVMRSYLATVGRDKVGFSLVEPSAPEAPVYVGGTLGVIERNTMRYYLAIEAYLGALSVSVPEQIEKRLNDWHSGIERYPRQLHELERSEYLDMKRREIRRQQTPDVGRASTPPGPLSASVSQDAVSAAMICGRTAFHIACPVVSLLSISSTAP